MQVLERDCDVQDGLARCRSFLTFSFVERHARGGLLHCSAFRCDGLLPMLLSVRQAGRIGTPRLFACVLILGLRGSHLM
jgi:hypothetical protein